MARKNAKTVPKEKQVQGETIVENNEQLVEGNPEEDPEAVPGAEQLMEGNPEENPEAAPGAEQQKGDPKKKKTTSQKLQKKYMVTCRNKITKQIGGVDFKDGVGYTSDSYAASWFDGKDGYTVEVAE